MIYKTSKEYRIIIIPIVLLLLSLGIYLFGQAFGTIGKAMAFFLVAFIWYKYLGTTHTVEIIINDSVNLKSHLSTIAISGQDILKIYDYNLILLIKHANGRNSIISLIDNFGSLKSQLKKINPSSQYFSYNDLIEEEQKTWNLFFRIIIQFILYR
jgi:hypothetical protein